ncbi:hypothetical protein B0I35DRAFT_360465 [Stachybotrys elegans]|uniref:CMP/dCMP-type deaminase domain-containing protein n=1 Tax=Stachybotrys elegans TaxID=80388 RepID=A0A8K0SHT5_9HYPO|nr:hypothetical protein B0I35DRAFT_360465 [Stachybotrys elegans]
MVSIKSMGLAGARKLVRRLLRRPLPADGDDSSTTTSESKIEATSSAEPDESKRNNENSGNEKANTIDSSNHNATNAVQPTASNNKDLPPASSSQQSPEHHAADGNMAPGRVNPAPESPRETAVDKENVPPEVMAAAVSLSKLKLRAELRANPTEEDVIHEPVFVNLLDPAVQAERAQHLHFIGEALDMARLALRTNETPVGCVLVHDGKVIAKGMNATNVTRNGTRHAEFMALSALLSYPPKDGPRTVCITPNSVRPPPTEGDEDQEPPPPPSQGNEDGAKSHLYPYGQKFHPDAVVDRSILQDSILYVTVEPCVMCASLLRQLRIKKVYFGAVNDKFGGTGGVFSIHANSLPIGADGQTASAHPIPKPTQLPDGTGALGNSYPEGGGDGGNVERGYEIEGGWGRDEAVGLLRRFYVQENGRAPVPRKKEGRAARLAALLEKDGTASSPSLVNEETGEVEEEQQKDSPFDLNNTKSSADSSGEEMSTWDLSAKYKENQPPTPRKTDEKTAPEDQADMLGQ